MIYWTWPRPSEQDPIFPSVSLSHQKASTSLLPFSIRGQTDWNPQSQETNQLITWTTALSNSMKLWAMPCRTTQDGWVIVESSDKMWSTGEGNGKPLQYSCLENPMKSMKRQKDRTLKDDLPRSVGAQFATGNQWRNNSRKEWSDFCGIYFIRALIPFMRAAVLWCNYLPKVLPTNAITFGC